jgi:hypothetical protein
MCGGVKIQPDAQHPQLPEENTMESTPTHPVPVSKGMLWTGRVLSALPVPLFVVSGVMKFVMNPEVAKSFEHLGLPLRIATGLGITEIACTIIYAIPQTCVLGAILLTGYLGGAILTQLRVGEPIIMPIILGVVLWLGVFLREPRLHVLLPLRK